jgi:signal transduction histidine kinase/DNA-binding response OmpR family regulator
MIHGILEDSDGCIWLSTNKGLIKYNPRNDFFHGYSNPDLKVTEFSDDAYWECPVTGRLFFGGINGLTWIEPKESDIRNNYYRPELQFFDIQIARESFPLYYYMNKKDSALEIKNDVFSFALSFVAIDYMNGDNYEYAYILKNYNSEWTELQKTNDVSFTNLPAGEYLLKVKYKNDVFDAEENIYTLPIRKLPPWYLTTWAYWVYIILFVLICLFIIYIVRKSIIKRQMQIARNIKEEQKEKLLESKLNFFTHITHEFCTPLTVIRGVSDLIGKSTETDNRLNKYVSILQDNVTNLNDLIQEILDFRRVEEGKYDFSDIEEVEISALIEKQVEWFIPIAEQNRIRLEISVPDELHWNTNILGFNRILINLISNAFKYTDIEGEVKITAAMNDGQLMLKVYNTGPGIESSKYASVFDRYGILEDMEVNNTYSSATSRNGLGLSICHHITKRLKGNITVKSVVDEYAEFTVVLPSFPVTKTKTEKVPEISPVREENRLFLHTANDKKTVLVVDDNKDIVWLITNILSDSYIIKNAYSVNEAMPVIKSETPALIITDIMMSGVDGLEFIGSLKADKFTKHIPIVVISAKISEREQSEGLDIGADVYLTKPFSTLVLRSVVNRLLTVKDELKDYFYSPESAYKHTDGQLMHQEDKAFMDSVITIISDNLEQENLRPEFIADKLNMTTRSLYRRFKKYSTFSPSDFIKDYRFMYAAKLLITTNLTIQEVIYKVGISNKSYFYREFYKKYNMTPKEFRSGK